MTYKYFYLICLLGVTSLGGAFMLLILRHFKNIKKQNLELHSFSKALPFVAAAIFSWSLVAFIKIFDVQDFSLAYLLNDRLLSSLSNLFIASSIAYIPVSKSSKQYSLIKNREQWLIRVFIFFALIFTIFSIADKLSDLSSDVTKLIIVGVDSLVSIAILFLLLLSIQNFINTFSKDSLILLMCKFSILFLMFTQILLPLTKLLPELLVPIYPYILSLFLIGIVIFIFSLNLFFYTSLVYFQNLKTVEDKTVDEVKFLAIKKIVFGYNDNSNVYELELLLLNTENEVINHKVSHGKLLQPLIYWFLFAQAKRKNVLLSHMDIAISKFRMVEFWNKASGVPLTQDFVFNNDNGFFSLKVDVSEIQINNIKHFESKLAVFDVFKKHIENFIPKDVFRSENLNVKLNLTKYIEINSKDYFSDFLNN